MKYITLITLVILLVAIHTRAQGQSGSTLQASADSIRISDSLLRVQAAKDSLLKVTQEKIASAADSVRKVATARRKLTIARVQETIRQHPNFNLSAPALSQAIEFRKRENSEGIFYYIVGLVFYIALMRLFFYKYMSTMFTLFFRATLRQQQLREQLLQAPLPALLMNIFFVVSVGTYVTLVTRHHGIYFAESFWTSLLYAVALIASVYVIKFIFLNIVGWIFGISNVADTYIFIVFLINKMIGIFLLPFIALMAFPTPVLFPVVLTMSYILIGGMLVYRFLISYRPVRTEIKLNRLHFFLYICAFEIAPLLLIYKVLLEFGDKTI